jgi:uncharacterized protein (TIGR03435 family)
VSAAFTRINASVPVLIRFAFDLQSYQLVGGPEWLRTNFFDVDARADRPVSIEQRRLMLQSLLEDRFQLRSHRERRQMPVYTMVLARSDKRLGSNIASIDDCAKPVSLKEPADTPRSGARASGCGSMDNFARSVATQIGAPVSNKTGLAGLWQFIYYYAPDRSQFVGRQSLPPDLPASDPNLPSYEQALQEQLGLKLEAGRGPVDVLVIDSVQQPTEN